MFGKQNNVQATHSKGSGQRMIDPRNIRTFLSSEDTSLSASSSTDIPLPEKNNSEKVIQKNFVRGIEEPLEVQKGEDVPETSPFFTLEKINNPNISENFSDGIKVGQPKNENEVNFSRPEVKDPVPAIALPREEMQQRNSFQPIERRGDVAPIPESVSSQIPVENRTGQDVSPLSSAEEQGAHLKSGVLKWVIFFLVLLLLVLGFWGGYTYWKSQLTSSVPEEMPPIIITNPTPLPDSVTKPSFPYDWKIANTIIVDETKGKTSLGELNRVIADFQTYSGNGVLEFFFVDGVNNFSTLSIKEVLQKLSIVLPDSLAKLVQDSGEGRIYLVKKGSDVRMAMAIPTTSRDSALATMLSSEGNLLKVFTPLYGKEVFSAELVPKFNDQIYREYALRYFNIDTTKNYSLDYAFRRDTLFVGTNKDTLRDTLDMLDGKL